MGTKVEEDNPKIISFEEYKEINNAKIRNLILVQVPTFDKNLQLKKEKNYFIFDPDTPAKIMVDTTTIATGLDVSQKFKETYTRAIEIQRNHFSEGTGISLSFNLHYIDNPLEFKFSILSKKIIESIKATSNDF
jgi:hypothetical protein